ncbi:leucyl aminopeptidase [Mycetocola zhadangensis]|uniref:Probable cytosol aminopeptidase n=1 Tax=Mycetocola zhadangensis TaxID=1164595 RepID=A0A3L7ISL7_9MICO|nr:leucyl aminopeptidase [Mycetocola zhadangensis]RLQ81177.1 leucyl aminopeptidase [Mycetocola zhadangensis]GGF05411.1 putative cytosol aminopeptidase [Mycetocola zhadangensis]
MPHNTHRLIPADFTPLPSLNAAAHISVVAEPSAHAEVVGYLVAPDAKIPEEVNLDWATFRTNGFEGRVGQTLVLPRAGGPDLVAVGVGTDDERTLDVLRDTVAAFVRAASRSAHLALRLNVNYPLDPIAIGRAVAEAALLARYRYTALKRDPRHTPLATVEIITPHNTDAISSGILTGVHFARAASIARDLANTPAGHLTATVFAQLAEAKSRDFGLDVTVADKQKLIELGCGGILGVNAGSVEEPRMIILHYTPAGRQSPEAHVALVGKGIMFDSGGISLKPSDPMHLLMKMDMGGAAAIFGAMAVLRDLDCAVEVTAYLMCTDNMPSGSAMTLGDVLTARNGTTIEVKNTDAEGRLVMCDALVLATELHPDAIVDIATLTGASLMALGQLTAPAFGNSQPLVDRVLASAAATGEQAWQLPLERKYRKQLDSEIADIANLGGKYAGATTAALFLSEFVGDTPWAHLDIAGTMQSDADDSWRSQGATGYGARLLVDFLTTYSLS